MIHIDFEQPEEERITRYSNEHDRVMTAWAFILFGTLVAVVAVVLALRMVMP